MVYVVRSPAAFCRFCTNVQHIYSALNTNQIKPSSYIFAVAMCLIASMTVYRYVEISRFREKSVEYDFVVSAGEPEMADIKSRLRGMTFQSVDDEIIDEGIHRLTVRCPPDKIGIVKELLSRAIPKE